MLSRILHYKTVTSTNDLALEFAKAGASEWTVIVSEFQSKGRGRLARRWSSPRGKGLLFSILLRPRLRPSSAGILTHLAAKSVAEVLKDQAGLAAKLKRPNDVLVGGKKIAGILTEARGNGKSMDYVVVGIGLNVISRKRDIPAQATSIYLETGLQMDRGGILDGILGSFRRHYEELVENHGQK